MSEIDVNKYFQVKTNEYSHSQWIMVGDDNELWAEIRKQNEQLKAKEQECEELKKGVIKQCPNCGEEYLNPVGAELYEELKELKREKAEIKKYLGISDKTIMQRLEELQEFRDEAREREYRYKDALDEIKGLSQSTLDEFENDDEEQQLLYCKQISEQILDIINKAKEQCNE